ncbi:MAG: cell division protein FtsZ [Thermodesulfovibrionales bacterium]|nr:cell division protein FtsZ [Thermodesulfovibrionales bacterium]
MFEIEQAERTIAKIKVVGVGGGGCNAVNSMLSPSIYGVEFIAVNTDSQHLEMSLAPLKVQIGAELTRGLGAGANPVIGRQAALEDRDTLTACIEGANMLFITAGMGGGTGTGASPVIASIARELKILTVAVVTKPFYYEGRKRALNAEEGIEELRKFVDTLIVLPNDKIHKVVEKGTPLMKSFAIANNVLRDAIQGISDVILVPGLINLDFADIKTVMENAGKAVIGVGIGKGEEGALEAAKKAISNPFLEDSSIENATGILINITGGLNMSLSDVETVASYIYDSANDDANIILGAVINPNMEDEIKVTVIAAGIEKKQKNILPPVQNVKVWQHQQTMSTLNTTSRILSKRIEPPIVESTNKTSEEERIVRDSQKESKIEEPVIEVEDEYDIPAFLRKKGR